MLLCIHRFRFFVPVLLRGEVCLGLSFATFPTFSAASHPFKYHASSGGVATESQRLSCMIFPRWRSVEQRRTRAAQSIAHTQKLKSRRDMMQSTLSGHPGLTTLAFIRHTTCKYKPGLLRGLQGRRSLYLLSPRPKII